MLLASQTQTLSSVKFNHLIEEKNNNVTCPLCDKTLLSLTSLQTASCQHFITLKIIPTSFIAKVTVFLAQSSEDCLFFAKFDNTYYIIIKNFIFSR